MNRSYGNSSGPSFRSAEQIDYGAGCAFRNGIAEAVPLSCKLLKSERLGQQ